MIGNHVGRLVDVKAVVLVVGTVHVSRTKAHIAHDHIVRAVNAGGPTGDCDAVAGRGLARECQERLIDIQPGLVEDRARKIKDDRARTGRAVYSKPETARAGIIQIRHMINIAAPSTWRKCAGSFGAWKCAQREGISSVDRQRR